MVDVFTSHCIPELIWRKGQNMTVLVTGGCGYIGAHVVHALHQAGERVVVVDDLSYGKPTRIEDPACTAWISPLRAPANALRRS